MQQFHEWYHRAMSEGPAVILNEAKDLGREGRDPSLRPG